MGPRSRPIARAGTRASAHLDQGIGSALLRRAIVALAREHARIHAAPHDGARFGIEQPVQFHHAIAALDQVQETPPVRSIGFVQHGLRVDLMLEVPDDSGELPGIHPLGHRQ